MTAEILHTDADGDRLMLHTDPEDGVLSLEVYALSGTVYVPAGVVAAIRAALSGQVVVSMTREDARELNLILMSDRYRMDKGDDRPVPQPRWGANVRVSEAVAAALDSTPEG